MAKKNIITYSIGRQYRIKLRGKRRAKGRISLYLDEYLGTKTVNGKTKTLRNIEYLGISLLENPRTPIERKENEQNLLLAEHIRKDREEIRDTKGTGLVAPYLKKINFIDYFESYLNNYQNKDIRLVRACFAHFKEFSNTYTHSNFLKPVEVNEAFVKRFKEYLERNLNGDTPYNYFTKFRALCKKATDEGMFTKTPCHDLTISRPDGLKKEVLTFDEIALLPKTYCGNDEVKMAFLFCLNTGLRFVDVKSLIWKHIDLKSALLRKKQVKVKHSKKAFVTIDLNPTALKILNLREKGKPDEHVFHLKTLESSNKVLKNWVHRAGIEKHITWHCARHTFATGLLMTNSNIKTVSGLLGHSSLRHTEKYTHLVDRLKKEAVNNLPETEI
jgi:integrase/recombinase XerD